MWPASWIKKREQDEQGDRAGHSSPTRTRNSISKLTKKGLALFRQEKHDEALALFEEALTLQPNDPLLLVYKGRALQYRHRLRDALDAFEEATEIAPGFGYAWGQKANVLVELKKPHAALEAFDKGLSLSPEDAALQWTGRAAVLRDLGLKQEALESYNRALALDRGFLPASIGKSILMGAFGEDRLPKLEKDYVCASCGWEWHENFSQAYLDYEEYGSEEEDDFLTWVGESWAPACPSCGEEIEDADL